MLIRIAYIGGETLYWCLRATMKGLPSFWHQLDPELNKQYSESVPFHTSTFLFSWLFILSHILCGMRILLLRRSLRGRERILYVWMSGGVSQQPLSRYLERLNVLRSIYTYRQCHCFTARKRSCGKVIFSQVSVTHSVHMEKGTNGDVGISGPTSLGVGGFIIPGLF